MKNLNTFQEEFEKSPAGQDRISALKKQIKHLAAPSRDALKIQTEKEAVFGVVSCTHFGSLYSNVAGLRAFYAEAKRRGAQCILHCGDVCDGWKMYKGQEFEQHDIGWDAQAARFEQDAPDGFETYFITGNHDESLKKLAGIDPGTDLARRRKDWKLIGSCSGRVLLDAGGDRKCVIDMVHPGGGSAYALSYRPQKIVESLEGGAKPDMLLIGHYHKAEWMPTYRNICAMQAGCFQWQTPFMRDHALAAHVGGWIVKVRVGAKVNAFSGEFVAFYR